MSLLSFPFGTHTSPPLANETGISYLAYYLLYIKIRRRTLSTGRYCTPNAVAAILTAAIGTWAHVGTIQAQVVAIVVIARGRRPIAAVTTSITRRRAIEEAGVEEVIRETPKGFSSSIASSISSV